MVTLAGGAIGLGFYDLREASICLRRLATAFDDSGDHDMVFFIRPPKYSRHNSGYISIECRGSQQPVG